MEFCNATALPSKDTSIGILVSMTKPVNSPATTMELGKLKVGSAYKVPPAKVSLSATKVAVVPLGNGLRLHPCQQLSQHSAPNLIS